MIIDRVRMTSVALLVVGSVPLAGCFSIPGHPDGPQVPACLEHAVFGNPEDSPYVLPYPAGSAYKVFQTYCGPVSHGKDGQMSIDFLMPLGSEVVAARAGIVRQVVDEHKIRGRRFNFVYIQHEDASAAFYAHLQLNSVKVQVDDRVEQGQVIALSGSSGTSLAHLHFGVNSTWPARSPDDIPVNFRNSQGALDERGGLQRGVAYRAVSYNQNVIQSLPEAGFPRSP